eukprot:5916120-Prymnesium_polylepis.1
MPSGRVCAGQRTGPKAAGRLHLGVARRRVREQQHELAGRLGAAAAVLLVHGAPRGVERLGGGGAVEEGAICRADGDPMDRGCGSVEWPSFVAICDGPPPR